MHGTRAATAGCGSLARSYRARSQVLVIEELNELAGRHPYDLDKPPLRSEESDPRSLWASNNRLVASVDGWRDIITAQRGWPLGEPRPLSKLHDEHEAILRAVTRPRPLRRGPGHASPPRPDRHKRDERTPTREPEGRRLRSLLARQHPQTSPAATPRAQRPTSELTALTDNPPNEPASARHK